MNNPSTAIARPQPSAPAPRASGGDEFRAKLRDLNWVRDAGPVELRHAVHALCWRLNRDTVDGFCSDPALADKVLIVARGVRGELDAKLGELSDRLEAEYRYGRAAAETIDQYADERLSLRRRKTSADTVVTACATAAELYRDTKAASTDRERRATDATIELGRAIAGHREQVHPDDACDADTALWKALDGVRLSDGYAGTLTVGELIARHPSATSRRRHAA